MARKCRPLPREQGIQLSAVEVIVFAAEFTAYRDDAVIHQVHHLFARESLQGAGHPVA